MQINHARNPRQRIKAKIGDDLAERIRRADYQARQREAATELTTPKVKPQIILPAPTQFEAFPDIKQFDLKDYFHLTNYVAKVVNTHSNVSIRDAVTMAVASIFINHPLGIYQPGKDYSRPEREFTKQQLRLYTDTISLLEIVSTFGYQHLGNFGNRKTYNIKWAKNNMDSLATQGPFDIAYMFEPSQLVPHDISMDETVGQAYSLDLALAIKYGPEDYKAMADKVSQESDTEDIEKIGLTKALELLKNYLKREGLDKDLREVAQGLRDMVELAVMTQKIIETPNFKQPTELDMVTKILPVVKPRGLLILEESAITEIPGFRRVIEVPAPNNYTGNVQLYQRQA